jgi:hypothetical protein
LRLDLGAGGGKGEIESTEVLEDGIHLDEMDVNSVLDDVMMVYSQCDFCWYDMRTGESGDLVCREAREACRRFYAVD